MTAAAGVDPDAVCTLPAAAARWLRHVIEPGTPPWRGVRLSMHGEIRVGSWRPFTARQILGPAGFVWAARAGRLPLRIRGFDSYAEGKGEMRWAFCGLVPVMSAGGPDVSRSAAGRHAAEAVTLVPGGALDPRVTWEGVDAAHAVATVTHPDHTHRVTIEVDDAGRLQAVSLPRWGRPGRGGFAAHPFGAVFEGEASYGGCTLPRRFRAGWWPGTDRWDEGEFLRATIDAAELF
ncbi:MAG: hypothetical protein IT198_11190 [Acidimicrobiia bacterium]|nr:hypothetical protein [Acidimicrobiia bacterium]